MNLLIRIMVITYLVHYGAANKQAFVVKESEQEQRLVPNQLQAKSLNLKFSHLWPDIRNDKDVILLGQVLAEIERGRGKSHKYKKLTKTLYPLFMGVLIAKVVLIPLILKMLTAVSTAALVMSKIALITTGLLALKWIFSDPGSSDAKEQHTQFELVYVPPAASTYGKSPYHRSIKNWGDQSWADSNVIPDATTTDKLQKYIPVNTMGKQESTYHGGYGGASSTTSLNDAAASDLYRYNHHNYNHKPNDGKPFL